MEYTINKGSDIILTGSKKDVVEYIIARDAWRLSHTPKTRYLGDATMGYDADAYVPTFFDEVAMNPNDTRADTSVRYSVMPTKPSQGFLADKVARPYIVTDEAGRVVDVREWLEECRAALRQMTVAKDDSSFFFPAEKPSRTVYRKTTGFRQALSTPLQPDDDWRELVGNIPSRFTKKPRGGAMTGKRLRRTSRSWKDSKGCVRSWQKNAARGRMPVKTTQPLDLDALTAELVRAS